MSSHSESIFKARKVGDPLPPSSGSEEKSLGTVSGGYAALELTKTKKFCVSKLPALPSVLENASKSGVLNGYSDNESSYALVVDESTIHVWNYKSTDSSPLTIQFPLDITPGEFPPLAILTKPYSGSNDDPGIMIIDSEKGLIKFYESVQHAPALGLIDNKLLELTINLNDKNGEYIASATNVEPAGIVITTSWKRCILISLRDLKGKPRLATFDLLSTNFSKGLISGIFNGFSAKPKNDFVDNEIVSVRSGKIFNHGMSQEIVIQDSVGTFYLFTYHLMSANGMPFIDEKKSFKHNLTPYLENNMHGFLPGSSININFLDLWPLNPKKHDDRYLVLCQLDNMFNKDSERELVLAIIKIDSTGVLLMSSHRVQKLPSSIADIENKPQLFLPADYGTAFITIGNSVMLVDLEEASTSSLKTFQYYEPRWEDVIRFKSSIKIIGQGYEDKVPNSNSAVIFITEGSGILRVERFGRSHDYTETDNFRPDNASQKVKSQMEQAIFYRASSEIDFDLYDDYEKQDVVDAVKSVIGEILRASSPYFPSFLPSVNDFLSLKSKLLHGLLKYTNKNFPGLTQRLVPVIIEKLEMNEVGLKLWEILENDGSSSVHLKKEFEKVLSSSGASTSNNEDLLRKFFCQDIENINETLNGFVEKLVSENYSSAKVVELIVETIYNGFYEVEAKYIMGNSHIPSTKLWIFDTTLLITIEQVFTNEFCEKENEHYIVTQKTLSNLVKLCKVLYYLVNYAITYMTLNANSNGQLKEYIKWYHSRKAVWISALLRENLYTEAIQIAEQYEDFSSLIHILEIERQKIVDNNGESKDDIKNYITEKYESYFEKFGYSFAVCLYDHCLKNGKIQILLLGFPNHTDYLERYFAEHTERSSHVSWIKYLLTSDFTKLVSALVNSATLKSNDSLDNLQVKYSLAKLSVTAARSHTDLDGLGYLDEMLTVAEDNLTVIRAQDELFRYVSKYVSGQRQLLTMDYILKNFVNDNLDYTKAKGIIEPSLSKFVNNIRLPPPELINILTTIKPTSGFSQGYTKALHVCLTIKDKQLFKSYCQTVWLRLLTIVDDWPSVAVTKYKADAFVKESARELIFYKTLSSIAGLTELIEPLDELLSSKDVIAPSGNTNIDELHRDLRTLLSTNVKEHDLVAWVEAIKEDIKTRK